MKCSQCGQDNPSSLKFCQECATALSRRCSKCGAQLSPTAKFCVECAAPITGADGIMALFGAPLAHENHAVRACQKRMIA